MVFLWCVLRCGVVRGACCVVFSSRVLRDVGCLLVCFGPALVSVGARCVNNFVCCAPVYLLWLCVLFVLLCELLVASW